VRLADAGRRDVVVLDQQRVGSPTRWLTPAAGDDGRLLEQPQPRGGLAGVAHDAAGAGHGVDEAPGPGRDPREVGEEVQGGALAGEDRRERAGDLAEDVAACDRVAVADVQVDLDVRVDLREHSGHEVDAGDDPVGAGDQLGLAGARRRDGRAWW
jgi:hypothetical protein